VVFQAGCFMEGNLHAQNREERKVKDRFTGVEVSSGVDLVVEQGQNTEIVVEASSDHIDDVKTQVRNGVLKVDMSSGVMNWFKNRSATVYVTMPVVEKLSASGGADLKSNGTIHSEDIEVYSSGGADVEIEIQATRAVLNSSGGADIVARGETEHLEASASGGSDIKARKLNAKFVTASSSGGADVEVYASEEMRASASGGADVNCYGPGQMMEKSTSGGGDVTRR
ncbi:MAG: head GIN domain-containing protein, partial [Marinilabiliaceae bacterium]